MENKVTDAIKVFMVWQSGNIFNILLFNILQLYS